DERDLLTEDAIWKVLHGQGISKDDVEIIGFACYSHHVRFADRELPPVVPERSWAIDGRAGRVAVEPQSVVTGPLPEHLGV
ncbi:FAD-binding monooxygenase, partial [Mycolicibacterium austroafricanum]